MKKYCFGIDVGGTSVKCGLFTTEGVCLDKWEIPTRTENNGEAVLPDIAKSVKAKIAEKGLAAEEIAGIGIGVPGPVMENGCMPFAVNLHWGFKDVEGELSELSGGFLVKAGNDANVAALGEQWKGGGAGARNIIMVTLGTGVGGGIIVDGKIVPGFHGAGGEIGHAHVDDNIPEKCNCGRSGCLEQVASATGIGYLARRTMTKKITPSIMRNREKVSAKTVFDAVKEGDELAIEVAEEFGAYLGKALATLAGVVDPQIFVIGGGVSKAGPIILDYISKNYRKYCFPACMETDFALAMLGNDAGIYGAARLVCQAEEAKA